MRWNSCTMALVVLGVLGGCATLDTLERARATLAQAERAGAATTAPYPFHRARAFLEMAEHETDEFDWAAARTWAGMALEDARQALENARGASR